MQQKFHTSQDMAIPPFIPLKPTLSWQILMDCPYLTDVKGIFFDWQYQCIVVFLKVC